MVILLLRGAPVLLILVLAILGWRYWRRRNKRPQPGPPAIESLPTVLAVPQTAVDAVVNGELASHTGSAKQGTPEDRAWQKLCALLKGKGPAQYAEALKQNYRFRTRDGLRFTLYHTKAAIAGREQDVCVIVRTMGDGNVSVRRIICGLARADVLYADEPRLVDEATPGLIGIKQAQSTDTTRMETLPYEAVLDVCGELSTAYQVGRL